MNSVRVTLIFGLKRFSERIEQLLGTDSAPSSSFTLFHV